MDKGFRKVESDNQVIIDFRRLCYHSNEKLDASYQILVQNMNALNTMDEAGIKSMYKNLEEIRLVSKDTIDAITTYTYDYSSVWKKTLSIEALNRFKSLLELQFQLLEKEIETFNMEILHQQRSHLITHSTKIKVKKLKIEN